MKERKKKHDTIFSPKLSGVLSIVSGTMLLVLNVQDGSILKAILVAIVLASGIGVMLKS